MPDIWLTSDTHYNHANFLNFTDDNGNKIRPFSCVEEMNEIMIERHNSLVKDGDKVYHLGDVLFGDRQRDGPAILSRLKGKKRLIVGNHDVLYGKYNVLHQYFQRIYMWRVMPERKLIMSHVPLHESTLAPRLAQDYKDGEVGTEPVPVLNVHGHIHHNPSPDGPYKCVCVEQTDYYPVHIDEIAEVR